MGNDISKSQKRPRGHHSGVGPGGAVALGGGGGAHVSRADSIVDEAVEAGEEDFQPVSIKPGTKRTGEKTQQKHMIQQRAKQEEAFGRQSSLQDPPYYSRPQRRSLGNEGALPQAPAKSVSPTPISERQSDEGGGGRQASNDAENVEPQPRVRASTVGYKDGKVLLMNKANNAANTDQSQSDKDKHDDFKGKLVPTVFKWHAESGQPHPKNVWIAGSFNDWQLVAMHGAKGNYCIVVNLGLGKYQYKFKVDDKWSHNPKEKTVQDGHGGLNNVITVRKSDFEVFEALDMDCKDVAAKKKMAESILLQGGNQGGGNRVLYSNGLPDPTVFSQEIPVMNQREGEGGGGGGGRRMPAGPPILPPHLLQVMLNKDIPLSCEPTLLPLPNHVMLNHMYALSIKDQVMVMSATQRYKRKYVTTLYYKPVE